MKKRGQVWIETVTYTLVAFVLIGLVLSFVKPKVEELQDQAAIDQSITIIKQIDSVISEIDDQGVGNKRKIEMSIKRGNVKINSENNSIEFSLEGNHLYSQPGTVIQEGGLEILTEEKGKFYLVTIKKNYFDEYNITYFEKKENKILSKSPTPHILYITNKGAEIGQNLNIDFQLG
ncbi:MAG TPA: hypothetical protein VJ895_00205 [Candidatus Nanoarchaeia archaeon]|nr:hypothetical protein [Candidatus Nanoarchaeia archaeon]